MRLEIACRKCRGFCLGALLSLFIGIAAGAEPDLDVTYRKSAESLRHDSLTLKIAMPKSSFFIGELVPLTFQFEDTKNTGKYEAWTGSYDRSGRIPMRFVVDGPAGSYCDPLAVYFGSRSFMAGGLGNDVKLGHHEQVFHLNEWIRFDWPGTYRFYTIPYRVSYSSDNVSRPVELVSPVMSIVIRSPTAEEQESTFHDALAVLNANPGRSVEPAVCEALSRLRYLDIDASRRHLRNLLGQGEVAEILAKFGLIGTREPDAAIALLEEGMAAPEVAISESYIETLAELRRCRENGKGKQAKPPHRSIDDRYGDRADWKKLVEVFDSKTGRARAVCASSLLTLIEKDRRQDQYEAEAKAKGIIYKRSKQQRIDPAATAAKIRVPLAENFLELNNDEQETLLRNSWKILSCPEWIPPLRKIVERPTEQTDPSFYSGIQSLAVLRLAELAPGVGKPLVLEDLRRLYPRYSLEVFCSLPNDELKKELPLLISHFAGKERVNTDKIAGVISHLADDTVFDAVKTIYLTKEGKWECITQVHCITYFIKVRRAEGLDLAFHALTFRGKGYTHCYSAVASDVLAPHYGADVETRLLMVLLTELEPEVITDVTRVLLAHGTDAVIDPLLGVIERLSPTAINEDYSFQKEAGARHYAIEELIRTASADKQRWKLTPKQKARLKSCLALKQEREAFQRDFVAD